MFDLLDKFAIRSKADTYVLFEMIYNSTKVAKKITTPQKFVSSPCDVSRTGREINTGRVEIHEERYKLR